MVEKTYCFECKVEISPFVYEEWQKSYNERICLECYDKTQRCGLCGAYNWQCRCCHECGDIYSSNEQCDWCCHTYLSYKEW